MVFPFFFFEKSTLNVSFVADEVSINLCRHASWRPPVLEDMLTCRSLNIIGFLSIWLLSISRKAEDYDSQEKRQFEEMLGNQLDLIDI